MCLHASRVTGDFRAGGMGYWMTDADSIRWRTSLAELETTATDVSANDVPELAGRLEALKVRLVLGLQTPTVAPAAERGDEDRLLDPQQAAALLGVKVSWIYDHSAELAPVPFPGRLLRFSEARLRRWMRRSA
jgi:predicted DNA-binding transcriptional regulator AlpA